MDTLISVLVFVLLGVAVLPLLLLGVYVVADRLGLRAVDRLLDLTSRMLTLQLFGGGLVNTVGGLALAALGVWATLHFEPWPHRMLSMLLVPFGLWRTARGISLLMELARADRAP